MFNCQRFDQIKNTPHKKVKFDQASTLSNSIHNPSKMSIFDKLKTGKMGVKKQLPTSSNLEISEFLLPFEYKHSSESNEIQMQEQLHQLQQQVHELQQNQVSKLMLNRKFTFQMEQQPEQQLINALNLYRNNSTCNQSRNKQEINLGDNIYLKKLNSKIEMKNTTAFNHFQNKSLRLEQDYEIQQNLKMHKRNHQSYICLNKIQRIFYYVKKISLSWQAHQNYQFLQEMVSQQIKIYHNDPKDYFLRFYQEWIEQNSLYMTFQVGVQSLEDSNRSINKLRQIQVWDLLRDCGSALKWLKQSQGFAHLNIKPGNIIKCQRKFKIVDPYCKSEMLKVYLEKQKQNWNGWQYLAPQIINYSFLLEGLNFHQSDVYALGMCVIQNLLGQRFLANSGKTLRHDVRKHLHAYSPALTRLLLRMISKDPLKRPNLEDLCEINMSLNAKITEKPRRRFSV